MTTTPFGSPSASTVHSAARSIETRGYSGGCCSFISQRDIIEKLDGKDAKATVEEVTLGPGQEIASHRHAGPVFGYVLEGEYEHALDDDPVKTFKAGDTFYEPSGCVHPVTKNPSTKARTRLLAVILHPRDSTEITVPMDATKK